MTRARDVANLIGSGNFSSTTFTATAGQTVFTISHTQGFIQVFMNGLLLDETVDYTSNGSAVTLTSGAAAGDEIEVVAYNTFSVGDALNQAAADTRYVNASGDTMTGTLVAGTNLQVGDSSITQQYPNLGYVADFQASSGSQTYISIAEPGASTLGNTGVVIGEDTTSTYITQRGNKPINIATSDTNRIIIDGSGRVTMPSQPYGRARGSVGSTVSHSSGAVINWFTSEVAQGGMSMSNNGRWTVPVSGVYLIHAKAYSYDTRAGHAALGISKNGSPIAYTQCEFDGDVYSGRLDWSIVVNSIYNASANDYFELVTSTDPNPWAWYRGNTNNAFEIYLLG